MTTHFFKAAGAALMLGLVGCSQGTQMVETSGELPVMIEAAENANLAAVLIYADWCGSCKTLDPKVSKVKADHTFETTSFVTLDYTTKNKTVFYVAADAAGVEPALRTHLKGGVKTGQLLLVDLDDQTVIGVIKKNMDEAEIAAAIRAAASAA